MNKLRKTALLLGLIMFFTSCNEENDALESEIEFVSVDIPEGYKSSENGRGTEEEELTFEVTVMAENGVSSIGYGRMVFPDDESISSFELSENIFAETGLETDFWVNAASDASGGRIDATNGCKCKDLPRGNGRGNCRLRCWGGVVIAVGVIVGAAITQ